MAGIMPWVQPAQVSALRQLPNVETMVVRQPAPPASRLAQGQSMSTWIPDWTYNSRFMALGSWKNSVDRVGVLHNPNAPVAWKGNSPRVIYVWTGRSWYQITPRDSELPLGALRRELYNITRMTKRNSLVWYEEDMPVLAQQATAWGYYWMGEVTPAR